MGNLSVESLRDQTTSDLVVLLRTQDTAELCGLSAGFNGLQQSDPPTDVNPERDAFNVVAAAPAADGSSTCNDTTLPHELGHSLAAGHDYAASVGFAYWKPYAHALPCLGENGTTYFSLMWGRGVGPGGGRGDVITNPDALLGGRVCGSEGVPGVEPTQANNVRAMTEAAPYVAAYRGATVVKREERGVLGGGAFSGFGLLFVLLFAAVRQGYSVARRSF